MFILKILCGVILGFIFGLLPNLHINLLGYIFSLFGFFVLFKSHFYFFFSFCISQSLTNIIPSFLFFSQTQDTLISPFLGRLPSSLSSLKETLSLSFLGFLLGALFSVCFLPLFYFLFLLFSDFYFLIFFVLFLVLLSLIFQEKHLFSRLLVFSIIVLSGTLGVFTLKYNFFFKEPLIPCIFGLFVLPNFILTFLSKPVVSSREEVFENSPLSFKEIIFSSFLGSLFSSTVAIFPSLSPGLSMSFAFFFLEKRSFKKTVVVFSSILSSVLLIYFFMSLVFNKHRLGFLALLSLHNIFPKVTLPDIFFLAFSFLLVVSLSSLLFYVSFDLIYFYISKFDKKNILLIVSLFTFFLVYFFCGVLGFFLLFLSTAIGFLPILYNKNRLALMSYLIIPTIIFFI